MRQTLHFPPYIMLSWLWAFFVRRCGEDMIQESGDRRNFLPKEVNLSERLSYPSFKEDTNNFNINGLEF